jgi:hypothetical protein
LRIRLIYYLATLFAGFNRKSFPDDESLNIEKKGNFILKGKQKPIEIYAVDLVV